MKAIFSWIINNKDFLTLILTFLIGIITLFSTIITRKMLFLSSRPTINLRAKKIDIIPEIKENITQLSSEDVVSDNIRYCISINIALNNIGSNPAQKICLDASVDFIKRKPCGYKSLPIHLPEYVNVLSPISVENSSVDASIRFDNYIAKEIIKDFFEARKNFIGSPFLPTLKELKKPLLWHSPKINVNCFYSDIQGHNYCTTLQLFFHIYYDSKEEKMKIYLLNMNDFNFLTVCRITNWYRNYYFKRVRHLRYTAFDGQKYKTNELILLIAGKKNHKANNKNNKQTERLNIV